MQQDLLYFGTITSSYLTSLKKKHPASVPGLVIGSAVEKHKRKKSGSNLFAIFCPKSMHNVYVGVLLAKSTTVLKTSCKRANANRTVLVKQKEKLSIVNFDGADFSCSQILMTLQFQNHDQNFCDSCLQVWVVEKRLFRLFSIRIFTVSKLCSRSPYTGCV